MESVAGFIFPRRLKVYSSQPVATIFFEGKIAAWNQDTLKLIQQISKEAGKLVVRREFNKKVIRVHGYESFPAKRYRLYKRLDGPIQWTLNLNL